VCASLPNASESIPARCSGSAALSSPQASSPPCPRHCGTAAVLTSALAIPPRATGDPRGKTKKGRWGHDGPGCHLTRMGCAARRVSTENAASSKLVGRAARQSHGEHDPLPSSLATVTSPPIMRASLREMARPSPVPPNRASLRYRLGKFLEELRLLLASSRAMDARGRSR
jgi:hypothetical protein